MRVGIKTIQNPKHISFLRHAICARQHVGITRITSILRSTPLAHRLSTSNAQGAGLPHSTFQRYGVLLWLLPQEQITNFEAV
jgi:hypothetical protein